MDSFVLGLERGLYFASFRICHAIDNFLVGTASLRCHPSYEFVDSTEVLVLRGMFGVSEILEV
jgi:hypothetical protein